MSLRPGATAELRLPSDIFSQNPQRLLDFLGLVGEPLGGDRWAVQVADPDGDLLAVHELADEVTGARNFSVLERVHPSEVELDQQGFAEIERMRERLVARASSGAGGDLAALFHHIQVELVIAGHRELADAAEQAYESLGQVRFEDSGEPAFASRSAYLVLGDETLLRRVRLPAIVFRLDQDPDVIQRMTEERTNGSKSAAELVFQSSSNLFANIVGLVRYFAPLIGCLSPRFWCISAQRPLAAILFPLGIDMNGVRAEPMEPLQLLPVSGPEPRTLPRVEPDPATWGAVVAWWTERLNEMFDYLTDPVVFVDRSGLYSPQQHQNWLLNIDQVFVLMNSLLTQARDVSAQRVIMNDLLDTFAGRIIGGDNFEKLFQLSEATRVADRVRAAVPADVAEVVMPAVDRAVKALRDTQDGFFIQRQTSSANLRLRQADGTHVQMAPEAAVAKLMKLYRNSVHGFGAGGRRGGPDRQKLEASILAHHNGNLPSDLVLLPYLYLLDMLTDPDNMARRISTSVSRG